GLHVIAALPGRYGPPEYFLERTAAAGVAVRPLTDYGRTVERADVRLVLGYAHQSPARIRDGVRLMAQALRA
ncbi:PLP-dependent aminotransferase family protein, partial [Streptomyces sp. NPDC127044]